MHVIIQESHLHDTTRGAGKRLNIFQYKCPTEKEFGIHINKPVKQIDKG